MRKSQFRVLRQATEVHVDPIHVHSSPRSGCLEQLRLSRACLLGLVLAAVCSPKFFRRQVAQRTVRARRVLTHRPCLMHPPRRNQRHTPEYRCALHSETL
jgi:hypothetical protein